MQVALLLYYGTARSTVYSILHIYDFNLGSSTRLPVPSVRECAIACLVDTFFRFSPSHYTTRCSLLVVSNIISSYNAMLSKISTIKSRLSNPKAQQCRRRRSVNILDTQRTRANDYSNRTKNYIV
jgi:hypothetical protein